MAMRSKLGALRSQNRYPGIRSGLGEPIVVSKQGRKLRTEYPRRRQVDRVQGPEQPVRLDHGGADNVFINLNVFEGVKQPLRIGNERRPVSRYSTADLDPQQV